MIADVIETPRGPLQVHRRVAFLRTPSLAGGNVIASAASAMMARQTYLNTCSARTSNVYASSSSGNWREYSSG